MSYRLNIVNRHLKFQKVSLQAPSKSFYLHIAAEIDHSPLPVFLTTSARKKKLIRLAKNWCARLKHDKNIISAVVFKARVIPPGHGKVFDKTRNEVQEVKFDFSILIEANSPYIIDLILKSKGYREIQKVIMEISKSSHIARARNIKHIGPVDHSRQGVFLFNYFIADNVAQNLAVWEYTAGWFQQETGLDNSTVLLSEEGAQSKYSIINHCRWNKLAHILPSLIFKKSFHRYVLDNFFANKVAANPILYTIA